MATYPWYSEEACKESCSKFVRNHPQKNMDLLRDIATVGAIKDFRDLCNCLYVNQYKPEKFYSLSYNESIELRTLCNARIHNMLGDLDELYNQLFKVWRSERWGGDESWRLFCDACKPHEESKAIIALISLKAYLGQILTLDKLPEVNCLYSRGGDYNLAVESTHSLDLDIPSDFKKANAQRKEHTLRWRKFMAYIWNEDFDSGREMIYQFNQEYEAYIAERRRANGLD